MRWFVFEYNFKTVARTMLVVIDFFVVPFTPGLHWKLFSDGVEGWVTVACAIGPLPLSRVCRYVLCARRAGDLSSHGCWPRIGILCWRRLLFGCHSNVFGTLLETSLHVLF